jgi:hypothetical protein
MSVCGRVSVCVYCVYVAGFRLADPPSKESFQLCIGLRNCRNGSGPTKRCVAFDEEISKTVCVSPLAGFEVL